jgi:Domain of unknown function (DUF4124)
MSRLRGVLPLVVIVSSLAGARSSCADDIYRTVDSQGHVTYSDHAVSAASRKVTVDVVPANPENAARLAKEQAIIHASEVDREKSAARDAIGQQQQQLEAAAQARRCSAARNRYAAFAAGGRIWKADTQGNRVFYSDQEIEAERASSKAAMDSACTR